jgi:hypothetical protein
MKTGYYYQMAGGNIGGPLALDAIRAAVQVGRLEESTALSKDGNDPWLDRRLVERFGDSAFKKEIALRNPGQPSRARKVLMAEIPIVSDGGAPIAVTLYMLLSLLVLCEFSVPWGWAFLVNGIIAMIIGGIARSMGKRDGSVVFLGLILGPLGGLAGLIAAPQRKPSL